MWAVFYTCTQSFPIDPKPESDSASGWKLTKTLQGWAWIKRKLTRHTIIVIKATEVTCGPQKIDLGMNETLKCAAKGCITLVIIFLITFLTICIADLIFSAHVVIIVTLLLIVITPVAVIFSLINIKNSGETFEYIRKRISKSLYAWTVKIFRDPSVIEVRFLFCEGSIFILHRYHLHRILTLASAESIQTSEGSLVWIDSYHHSHTLNFSCSIRFPIDVISTPSCHLWAEFTLKRLKYAWAIATRACSKWKNS